MCFLPYRNHLVYWQLYKVVAMTFVGPSVLSWLVLCIAMVHLLLVMESKSLSWQAAVPKTTVYLKFSPITVKLTNGMHIIPEPMWAISVTTLDGDLYILEYSGVELPRYRNFLYHSYVMEVYVTI